MVVVKEFVLILRPEYNTGSEPFSSHALRDIENGEEVANINQFYKVCAIGTYHIFSCEKIIQHMNILHGFLLCVKSLNWISIM